MDRLFELQGEFWVAAVETLYMVALTLLIGGAAGLVLGVVLYTTRPGSLLSNRAVYNVVNVVINFFRPIPFIIFIAAVQPLSRLVIGTGIGNNALIFALSLAASFAIARIVEQNLLTVSPGVIEAARSMGAAPLRILRTVVIPEALGPLILGYTFVLVAIIDMTAVAGTHRRRRARHVRAGLRLPAVRAGHHVGRRGAHRRVRAGRAVPRQLARAQGAAPLRGVNGRVAGVRSSGQCNRASANRSRPPQRAAGEIRAPRLRLDVGWAFERDNVHRMTRLDANDATRLPITTDHDIEERVAGLLQRAIRRQWWTLYLDDDDLQRPVVMPMPGYPAHPHEPCGDEGTAAEVLANRLASVVAAIGAAKVIFVWERPGDDEFTAGDRAWAGALSAACRDAGVAVRAQLILHDNGVRWIAAEEYV